MTTRPLHMDFVGPYVKCLAFCSFHITTTEGIYIPDRVQATLNQTPISAIAEAMGKANKAGSYIKSIGQREYRITLMREEQGERWPLGTKSVIGWAIVREQE